jgi:hypothetical protein
MVTFVSFAVAAILLTVVFGAGWFLGLRTRSRKQRSGDDTKSIEAPSVIAAYDDNMEIPAALIGAKCKEAIERFAPLMGVTPVNLLRAALVEGLILIRRQFVRFEIDHSPSHPLGSMLHRHAPSGEDHALDGLR